MATPDQAVFGRDMLFNLASVIDWQVVTPEKQRQVDIDNVIENAKQVTHDYAIGNLVYVKITCIYGKLEYSKQGPYIITEVFTNVTVRVHHVQANERINIRWLKPHCVE